MNFYPYVRSTNAFIVSLWYDAALFVIVFAKPLYKMIISEMTVNRNSKIFLLYITEHDAASPLHHVKRESHKVALPVQSENILRFRVNYVSITPLRVSFCRSLPAAVRPEPGSSGSCTVRSAYHRLSSPPWTPSRIPIPRTRSTLPQRSRTPGS